MIVVLSKMLWELLKKFATDIHVHLRMNYSNSDDPLKLEGETFTYKWMLVTFKEFTQYWLSLSPPNISLCILQYTGSFKSVVCGDILVLAHR